MWHSARMRSPLFSPVLLLVVVSLVGGCGRKKRPPPAVVPAPVEVEAEAFEGPRAFEAALALAHKQTQGPLTADRAAAALAAFDRAEGLASDDQDAKLRVVCGRATLLATRARPQHVPAAALDLGEAESFLRLAHKDLETAERTGAPCPDDQAIRLGLADVLVQRARAGEPAPRRLAMLREATQLHADHPAAWVDLAHALEEADEVVEAAAAAARALKLLPDHQGLRALSERLSRQAGVEGSFKSARHSHFVARFEGYGEERLAWGVLDQLERARFSVGKALDLHPADPITVVIYTGAQYQQVTALPDWSGGAFDGKIRIREGSLADSRGTLEDTLVHEYVHAALRTTVPGEVPVWFHEGLAQQFEKNRPPAREVLARTGKAPLHQMNQPFIRLDADNAHRAYATAHAIVALMVERRGNWGLSQLLAEMKRGRSFDEALQASFATTLADLWAAVDT
jgi:tetratricopeptide (TPR) repeat protein